MRCAAGRGCLSPSLPARSSATRPCPPSILLRLGFSQLSLLLSQRIILFPRTIRLFCCLRSSSRRFFSIFPSLDPHTIRVYNGTTCLRSSFQTNSERALSISLFIPFPSHHRFSPILHDIILSLLLARTSFSRTYACLSLPTLFFLSLYSLCLYSSHTMVNKPLIGLTPISGVL